MVIRSLKLCGQSYLATRMRLSQSHPRRDSMRISLQKSDGLLSSGLVLITAPACKLLAVYCLYPLYRYLIVTAGRSSRIRDKVWPSQALLHITSQLPTPRLPSHHLRETRGPLVQERTLCYQEYALSQRRGGASSGRGCP